MSLKTRPTSYSAVAMATLFLMSACGGGDAEAPPPPVSVGEPSPNPPAPNPPAPNPPAPNPPAPPAPTPPAPPPPAGALLVTDFDESTPPAVQEFGGAGYAFEAGPTGGDGLSLRIDRAGGENFAGAFITTDPLPLSANRRTITARVFSPEAGIPFVLKAEYVDGNGTGQGTNTSPSAPVVAGWQTLTFVLAGLDFAQDYTRIVILPDLGNVGAGEVFFIDDITLLPEEVPAPPPPAGVDITITDFEESSPRPVQEFGGAGYAIEPAPAGGDGNALKITRPGGEVFAGAYVSVAPIPFSAERKTITARVFSPTAGTPMVAKAEFGDNTGTGEVSPQEAVVQGWQTLTWVFNNVDLSQSYTRFTLLPNLGTVGTGEEYFFDDITLLAAPVSGGGGGGGGDGGGATPPPPPPPPVGGEMGSGGPQTLTVASGDVKTGDGGNTMFVAGEALFSVNFLGSAEPDPPFNQAAWPDARTDNFAGITGISGGDIGYFQDDVNLSNASQKIEEGGWVVGTSYAPLGVPNFFRYFVLSGRVSDSAYMGLYVNAPNNGTVDVSSYSKIKIKVWGPAGMYERDNFDPVLQVTLTGPKVAGCTTGSGGSEITQNLTANQKNGAGGFYTMSLSGFTVSGLCEGDAGAADVLANLARVVVVVPGTSFNYTNTDTPQSPNYTSGVNLGPIGFTNR